MEKKEFVVIVFDPQHKTFIIHIIFFSSTLLNAGVHPFHRPQVPGLIAKKAFTKILAKYTNFADVFSPELAFKLLEYIGINNHTIKLVKGQQLFYRTIYSLGPVELEILKANIDINLANRFIRKSKSPAGVFIFFD